MIGLEGGTMHCVEPGPSQVAVTFEVIGCFRTRGAAMVLPAEDEVRHHRCHSPPAVAKRVVGGIQGAGGQSWQ